MIGPFKSIQVGFGYSFQSCLVHSGYFYVFGGTIASTGIQTTADRTIRSAKILEDGSLAPSNVVGVFPAPRSNPILAQRGDYVFVIGSALSGAIGNDVTRYKLGNNGTVSDPLVCPPLFASVGSGGSQMNDHVFFFRPTIGGTAVNQLWSSRLTEDGLQEPKLVIDSPLIGGVANTNAQFIAHGSVMLSIGGFASAALQTAIFALRIVNGAGVGTWKRVGEIPLGMQQFGALIIDSTLLLFAGRHLTAGAIQAHNRVYAAKLDVDGNLVSAWKEVSTMVNNAYNNIQSVAATDKHVYWIGGYDQTTRYNNVQYAPILRGA